MILFILVSLATWRITYMLINESGPFNIFIKLNNYIIATRKQFLINLFSCFYCLSIWVSFFMSIGIYRTFTEILLNTLACSAVAIIINEVIDK